MKAWTRLLLAGVAVWALSICPARGDIQNGDFSAGLTGWNAFVTPDDPSLALVEVVNGQLHVRVANNYVYDSVLGWQLQEPDMSGVAVTQDFIPNGGAPLGTTGLQFDTNVQILNNPAYNTGTTVIIGVNCAGQAETWNTSSSTGGPNTITIPLPNLDQVQTQPVLDLYLYAFSGLDVSPDPASGASYNIVVDATFDNFKFVPEELAANVPIDIKPGTYPNNINLGSKGVIPVAICSTETFDAMQVDPLTVTLADAGVKIRGKGKSLFATDDVNGDGLVDMILWIETEGLALAPDATEALLKGMTYGGLAFEGIDQVRIVPATPAGNQQSAVPEPSSIMLIILGGMSVLRRRRLRGNNRN